MNRVSKLCGIVSKPMQSRYLAASPDERRSLQPAIDQESQWMIDKMARKGYQLEATVAGVYGLFTRGVARGTVQWIQTPMTAAAS